MYKIGVRQVIFCNSTPEYKTGGKAGGSRDEDIEVFFGSGHDGQDQVREIKSERLDRDGFEMYKREKVNILVNRC